MYTDGSIHGFWADSKDGETECSPFSWNIVGVSSNSSESFLAMTLVRFGKRSIEFNSTIFARAHYSLAREPKNPAGNRNAHKNQLPQPQRSSASQYNPPRSQTFPPD